MLPQHGVVKLNFAVKTTERTTFYSFALSLHCTACFAPFVGACVRSLHAILSTKRATYLIAEAQCWMLGHCFSASHPMNPPSCVPTVARAVARHPILLSYERSRKPGDDARLMTRKNKRCSLPLFFSLSGANPRPSPKQPYLFLSSARPRPSFQIAVNIFALCMLSAQHFEWALRVACAVTVGH